MGRNIIDDVDDVDVVDDADGDVKRTMDWLGGGGDGQTVECNHTHRHADKRANRK